MRLTLNNVKKMTAVENVIYSLIKRSFMKVKGINTIAMKMHVN